MKQFIKKLDDRLNSDYIDDYIRLYAHIRYLWSGNDLNTIYTICCKCESFELSKDEVKMLIQLIRLGQADFNFDEEQDDSDMRVELDMMYTSKTLQITMTVIEYDLEPEVDTFNITINCLQEDIQSLIDKDFVSELNTLYH